MQIAHFRDPWGGIPIVQRENRAYQAVYEVNGLPSIELPFHYPALPPELPPEPSEPQPERLPALV